GVLMQGESGAGKELVARLLHYWSDRVGRPFVAINCKAFAEGVLESELFGHEKGAFTGAVGTRAGCFERAAGGTLFLDEIAEVGVDFQAKLLRVLQDGEVLRVGGTQPRPVDVRIVAATNRTLREEIPAGRFREDLYFRLNVIPIQLAPLRDRREGIPPPPPPLRRAPPPAPSPPAMLQRRDGTSRSPRKLSRHSWRTTGPETSASSRTPSSGRWCWHGGRRSAPRTSSSKPRRARQPPRQGRRYRR